MVITGGLLLEFDEDSEDSEELDEDSEDSEELDEDSELLLESEGPSLELEDPPGGGGGGTGPLVVLPPGPVEVVIEGLAEEVLLLLLELDGLLLLIGTPQGRLHSPLSEQHKSYSLSLFAKSHTCPY